MAATRTIAPSSMVPAVFIGLTRSGPQNTAFNRRILRSNPLAFPLPAGKNAAIHGHRPTRPVPSSNPELLDQVRDVIRRKHYSIRTEQTYTDWIRRFILFHGKRHPSEMAAEEVTSFLTALARDNNIAASTQNQHVKASLTCRQAPASAWSIR